MVQIRIISTGGLRGMKENTPSSSQGTADHQIVRAYLEYNGRAPELSNTWESGEEVASRLIGKTGELLGLYTKPNEWPPDRLTAAVIVDGAFYLLKRGDVEFIEESAKESQVKDEDDRGQPDARPAFLHTKSPDGEWVNTLKWFDRLPEVGEYVARSADNVWFQVKLVVHCPPGEKYGAEVYAIEAGTMPEIISNACR